MRIIEVGPRDGLQNEPVEIPTEAKVAFINALSKSGVAEIEAGSFVSPKWVPQLADAEEVFKKIKREKGVHYSALVPNEKGFDRAMAAGVDKIAVFTAASETFNRKNINASIEESIGRFEPVLKKAEVPVRGYVSTAFWCPYEGKIHPEAVAEVVKRLIDLGVSEVSIGDTIGKASPPEVRQLMELLLPLKISIALHFHDTYGMAVANALTAWREFSIDAFDASAGGLGGCPYAKGATGNVATEDLVFALQASGAQPPVDPEKIVSAARKIEPHLSRPLASRLSAVFAT